MPGYIITCPYCFKEFDDSEFAFRSDIYYDELNDTYGANDIPREYIRQYTYGVSEKYKKFWDIYGGIYTEKDIYNKNYRGTVLPYEYPVISGDLITQIHVDDDNFVIGATDVCKNDRLSRKVCPHCNNPIPGTYGKHPIKRIAVIGIRGSGKTVYLSQLMDRFEDYVINCGLTAWPLSGQENAFVRNHPVRRGVPLPESTPPLNLSQPLFYDIVQNRGITNETNTIVLYDIAGENCINADKMNSYGEFVKNADGLILLIDPRQLGFDPNENEGEQRAETVIQTLYNTMISRSSMDNKSMIPTAVCISKSDQYRDFLPELAQQSIGIDNDQNGMFRMGFNGREYNQLLRELRPIINNNAGGLSSSLESRYHIYNYFALCAIGCNVTINMNGDREEKTPQLTPTPRRIEEPLIWMFKQFGYITSNENVELPNMRFGERKAKKSLLKFWEKPTIERFEIRTEEAWLEYLSEVEKT